MVRKRHRYVTLEVEKEDGWRLGGSNRGAQMTQALLSSIKNLYGVQGCALAKSGLHIEFLGPEAFLARVTMLRSAYKIVVSSLQFVKVVDGGRISLRTLHTAATIRHSNMFVTKYLRKQIESKLNTETLPEGKRAELEELLKASAKKGVVKKETPFVFDTNQLSPTERQEKLSRLQQILS